MSKAMDESVNVYELPDGPRSNKETDSTRVVALRPPSLDAPRPDVPAPGVFAPRGAPPLDRRCWRWCRRAGVGDASRRSSRSARTGGDNTRRPRADFMYGSHCCTKLRQGALSSPKTS